MNRLNRRELIRTGLVGMGALAAGELVSAGPARGDMFSFHHDHILGTSLDVWMTAQDRSVADQVEEAILVEIERLRQIFSTFDPSSELSRLNRATGPMPASADLVAVLRQYEFWEKRSQGAFSAHLGDVIATWKMAERVGKVPPDFILADLAFESGRPGWSIDAVRQTVTRLSQRPLNLNSAAKGYIIDQAVAVARQFAPDLGGLLVNLGGDIRVVGEWPIGVQDPHEPAENAAPLTALQLRNASVATSGGYQRYVSIDSRRYSHLIDPRTGRPAANVAGATVVAADSVTANVLATTLCVLSPDDGLRLIADTPGTACLIVAVDGQQVRSPGFAAIEVPRDTCEDKKDGDPAKVQAWPADFRVAINIELPQIAGGRYRRPYVAVWVEDADGKAIRSITVWGNDRKWLKDLNTWWKIGKDDAALVKAVTRATRAPGKYEVLWDGKDDKGNAVGQGTFTIKVEVHREHGRHVTQSGKLECLAEAAKITLEKNAETEATVVEYGKKK